MTSCLGGRYSIQLSYQGLVFCCDPHGSRVFYSVQKMGVNGGGNTTHEQQFYLETSIGEVIQKCEFVDHNLGSHKKLRV